MTPERAFVVIGGVLGMTLLVVSPPLYWGDENTHLLHSYRLAELRFDLSRDEGRMGVELPRGVGRLQMLFGLDRLLRERGTAKLTARHLIDRIGVEEGDDRRVVEVANSNYPLLGYVPQALGIALSRLCTRSVLLQLYGARLGNLIVWLALVLAAIRTAPAFKVPLAVLALAPMSVFVATTCSADAATNGLAFLWTAWIIRLALAPAPRGTIPILCALAVALALVKMLYGPLVLLILAVPDARLGGPRRRRIVVAALGGTVVVSALAWGLASRTQLASGIAYRKDAAFAENLAALSNDPLRVAAMVARQVLPLGDVPWIQHLTASMFGIVESPVILWAWIAAVVAAVLADERSAVWPSVRDRAGAAVAALGSLAAIALAAFLFWTPAGAADIAGFQGRYAIAVLPALLVASCPPLGLRVGQHARSRLAAAAFTVAAALLVWTIARGVSLYG